MRQLTVATVAVAAAISLTAVALGRAPAGHASTPAQKETRPWQRVASSPPAPAAPYYVVINSAHGTATVRRTTTGTKIATVRPPRGELFASVAAAPDDEIFVLAAETASTSHFYRLRLSAKGRPGRLVLTGVRPIPTRFGSCPAQLAGLAVSPGARLLAVAVLSNCPNGRAGPSEIMTAGLGSGRTLAKFHPGDGYPMWLSWTATGHLVYSWTGTKMGVFIIRRATQPGSSPRLLFDSSAGVGGFSDPNYPAITSDGSAVIVTVSRGTGTFAVAEFPVHGAARRLLTPPVRNPLQFCGPLWTDASGRRILAGCGDKHEYEITDHHLARLRDPWQLPLYLVPGAPLIAW